MNLVENLKQLAERVYRLEWNIALVENTLDGLFQGEQLKLRMLRHSYTDRWFADPFILDVKDNKLYLLVEEWMRKKNKSRIAKLTINMEDFSLESTIPVLEMEKVLSFPAICRENGKVFIYPEMAENGTSRIYEYDPEKNHCIASKALLNRRVIDGVMTELFGDTLLFGTETPKCNGKRLNVYQKKNDGFELSDKILFTENLARMAGNFFSYHGNIYRPAQDCNKTYGNGVVIQKCDIQDGKLKMENVLRLYSTEEKYRFGFHTFNMYNNVIIGDALYFKRPYIRKTAKWIYYLYQSL